MAEVRELREGESLRAAAALLELRPHVGSPEAMAQRIDAQRAAGYRIVAAFDPDAAEAAAVAGFRIGENLAWGRFLYVDDLVTDEAVRSQGVGTALLEFLAEAARENGCAELHLDSGVQRFGAHPFYLANRMDITSHHFGMKL